MTNIYLTKKEIKKLKPLSDDNAGYWGTCFEYEGGVLKVFSNILFENRMKRRIRKNIKRESPIIMYPEKKLYIIDNGPFLSGYKCQKAKGMSLKQLYSKLKSGELDITFDDFKTAYYDNFLKDLKKENVLLSDVKAEHIFYDNCFNLVDTDYYYDVSKEMTDKERNNTNIGLVNEALYYFLCESTELDLDKIMGNDIFFDYEEENFIDRVFCEILKLTQKEADSINKVRDYRFSDALEKEIRGIKL